jgi:hypothetical protein
MQNLSDKIQKKLEEVKEGQSKLQNYRSEARLKVLKKKSGDPKYNELIDCIDKLL